MDKNALISVIVPVYNTEKYLRECLLSILNQTYKNIEIITVDNGSTDNSGRICDEFVKEYENMLVIHQENQGAGGARNTGIKNASGKYIAFADSDDVLDREMIEQLYNDIADADMSCCGYIRINEEGRILEDKTDKNNSVRFLAAYFLRILFGMSRMGYQGYIWNKLYKYEIVNKYGIMFDEDICYNEDRLFLLSYLLHAKECVCSDRQLYFYRQRSDSVMGELKNEFNDNALTELIAYERMERLLGGHPFILEGMKLQEIESAKLLLKKSNGNEKAQRYIKDFIKKRRRIWSRPIVYASKLIDSF